MCFISEGVEVVEKDTHSYIDNYKPPKGSSKYPGRSLST